MNDWMNEKKRQRDDDCTVPWKQKGISFILLRMRACKTAFFVFPSQKDNTKAEESKCEKSEGAAGRVKKSKKLEGAECDLLTYLLRFYTRRIPAKIPSRFPIERGYQNQKRGWGFGVEEEGEEEVRRRQEREGGGCGGGWIEEECFASFVLEGLD